jgi:DNA-binding NarL/FixJ family response regulator
MDDCSPLAKHTLNAGAIGYALKDIADTELPIAIRRTARGDRYTSPRIVWGPRPATAARKRQPALPHV